MSVETILVDGGGNAMAFSRGAVRFPVPPPLLYSSEETENDNEQTEKEAEDGPHLCDGGSSRAQEEPKEDRMDERSRRPWPGDSRS